MKNEIDKQWVGWEEDFQPGLVKLIQYWIDNTKHMDYFPAILYDETYYDSFETALSLALGEEIIVPLDIIQEAFADLVKLDDTEASYGGNLLLEGYMKEYYPDVPKLA